MADKKYIKIAKGKDNTILLDHVHWCQSRLCRLVGLQFKRQLQPAAGILLDFEQDSIIASSIHMFFVFFPIAAVWINSQGVVTHKTLALPWRPFYASPTPARYVLETNPEILAKVEIGDHLDFT